MAMSRRAVLRTGAIGIVSMAGARMAEAQPAPGAVVEPHDRVFIHGHDPLARRLAEEIIARRQAEIVSMQGRLARLRTGGATRTSDYLALGGTRGSAPTW